jgi:hypothetical protein
MLPSNCLSSFCVHVRSKFRCNTAVHMVHSTASAIKPACVHGVIDGGMRAWCTSLEYHSMSYCSQCTRLASAYRFSSTPNMRILYMYMSVGLFDDSIDTATWSTTAPCFEIDSFCYLCVYIQLGPKRSILSGASAVVVSTFTELCSSIDAAIVQ